MTLNPGARLGPYEITAAIGAGGMGEVYRAKDTRLDRDVAIKVLPAAFAQDADRLARFEREAKAVAALSHPNILSIHDIGTHDGQMYVVTELLDGESLRDRLRSGALPVRKAIETAVSIARGLSAAHGKGIVHRDLKPENVFLLNDGQVKILDFGLARQAPSADHAGAAQTMAATDPGTVMGTVGYMAPEQVRGQTVDARADLFAFGAVLYEMVSGQRAFQRDTAADTMTAILTQDPPDLVGSRPDLSPALDRIIRHCLEKNANERFQSARDVAFAVEALSGATTSSGSEVIGANLAQPAAARPRRRLLAAMLLIAALAAAWWLGRASHTTEQPAWSQFTQLTDASGVETGPTISPDGSTIAYASHAKGSWDIYVQRVGGRNPIVVAGDPNKDEVWPAFSPDGKQIAFNQGGGKGGIFVVGATGESVRRLTDAGANPAWSPDGQHIVFSTEQVVGAYTRQTTSALWIVDVMSGAAPRKIDDGDAIQPAWSPSGARIAFWQVVGGQRDIVTMPAAGGAHQLVTNDAAVDWAPVWSPDGRFVYFVSDRGGSMGIWRIGIDEASGRTTSAPEAVAAGVDVAMDLPRFSADGSVLVFRSMVDSVNPAAIAFDPVTERGGDVRLLQHRTGRLVPTDASPDGRWMALNNMSERQQDIFIMRPDGTELVRLTDDMARDWIPGFTPDSTAVTFYSNKNGRYDNWSIRLDGSNRVALTAFDGEDANLPIFAPDGRRLVSTLRNARRDILIGTTPWPITRKTATLVTMPDVGGGRFTPTTWSRDGRWWAGGIVQASGDNGGNALYDVAAGTIRQLSDDAGGPALAWMPGSTRVVYFTASGKLMIQDVASLTRHEIDVKLPFPPESYRSIAASPDGRTLYYGAQQMEANIWKVEQPKTVKR